MAVEVRINWVESSSPKQFLNIQKFDQKFAEWCIENELLIGEDFDMTTSAKEKCTILTFSGTKENLATLFSLMFTKEISDIRKNK